MKKKILMLVVLMTAVLQSRAQSYAEYYRQLPVDMNCPSLPQIPDYTVSVSDFGGVGDGITLNTEAFRKAVSHLDKHGGGHLVVPAGMWMTGLISLKSHIDLHLEKNAIVLAAPDKALFIKEENGVKENKCTPLITASKRSDISITGEGVIDGNGAFWRPVKRSKVSDVEWKEYLAMGGTQEEDGKLWFPFNLKH